MVDHHDSENFSLLRFNALWEANYRHDSLLVFSTGRSPTLYKELRKEKPMLTPDITIMSVGTEITYGHSMVPDEGWVDVLNQKWDKNIVIEEASKFSELTPQAESEQRPHKVSFYIQKDKAQAVTKALSESMERRGLDVKIIYSGGIDLDILPQGAGKGQALAYLHKKFKSIGKLPTNTLVCGDSGNDAELFSIPDVFGVMVSNAQEELLQWHAENAKDNSKIIHASERCAAGIIQAISHFNLGPSTSLRDVKDFLNSNLEPESIGHEIVKFYLFYEKWRARRSRGILLGSLENSLYSLNSIRKHYGDSRGKQYRVWVDRVLPTKIGSDSWLVKFEKWELSGEERLCSWTTAILSSKDSNGGNELAWIAFDSEPDPKTIPHLSFSPYSGLLRISAFAAAIFAVPPVLIPPPSASSPSGLDCCSPATPLSASSPVSHSSRMAACALLL
ncbi:Sucrose-phosphatase 1, partial [Cucurbita argyrosperma subsp. sororia]